MSKNRIKIPKDELERTVVRSALKAGQMGVGIWLIENNTLELSEEITGYPGGSFQTFSDFFDKVVHEKDREMARFDLNEYLEGKYLTYRSTFRIVTKDNEIKWLLLKGKIEKDLLTNEERLHIMLYDVSGTRFLSGNDEETNLLNRDFFVHKLIRFMNEEHIDEKCAVIGMSIYNIQSIQDVYGYDIRRKTILRAIEMLRELVSYNSEIARFSNDSFGIFVSLNDNEDIQNLTKKMIESFRIPQVIDGRTIRIEINIGVGLAPEHSDDAIELLLFTEHALLQSKERGNYNIQVFNNKLSEGLHQRYLIKSEMANAIETNEFYLAYQPQIDATNCKIIGVEVLTRWENEKLGNVPPNIFIPIAESRGFMVELGQFIVEESIKAASHWLKKGYDFGTLSINVSPIELSSETYIDSLLYYCEKYDVPKAKINLEITEGVYMETIVNSLGMLNQLIEKGFKISVDDFGTGYSNLSFLSKVKLDTIKIDRGMIEAMVDKPGQVVVQSIIDLGKNLNYKVIAEGVETEEQLKLLQDMGCHYIQGYYFSKPLPEDELEPLLIEGKL